MRFAYTEEQEEFRATARRFLAERVRVRELIERPGAHDPALWKEIAALGWLGVDVPEGEGGQGLGFLEQALLVEEAGRALLPGPFTGAVLALEAFRLAGAQQTIPDLVAGERIAAVATADFEHPAAKLTRTRLTGDVVVPCGEIVDVVVLPCSSPGGPALVTAPTAEAELEPVESVDLTRPGRRARFDGVRAERLLDGESLMAWLDRARVLVAAEAVGGAGRALEMAVDYAKDREQFGRPIGSFQAVKHRAADAYRALEAARLAVAYAAWAIDAGAEDASLGASMAKAAACDAFVRCAADSIQIHGGIGFTWEHDAHLYYRRALANQAWFGDPSEHRERAAAAVLASL